MNSPVVVVAVAVVAVVVVAVVVVAFAVVGSRRGETTLFLL